MPDYAMKWLNMYTSNWEVVLNQVVTSLTREGCKKYLQHSDYHRLLELDRHTGSQVDRYETYTSVSVRWMNSQPWLSNYNILNSEIYWWHDTSCRSIDVDFVQSCASACENLLQWLLWHYLTPISRYTNSFEWSLVRTQLQGIYSIWSPINFTQCWNNITFISSLSSSENIIQDHTASRNSMLYIKCQVNKI